MPRANWKTEDGRAEATIEGAKGNAVIKLKRDKRAADAIEHHKSGMSLEEIAAELGTSTRSVRRYLPNVDWTVNTTKGC